MDDYIKQLKEKNKFMNDVFTQQKMTGLGISRGRQSLNKFA